MVAKNTSVETPRILTPYNEERVYKLERPSTGKPVFVEEVPACRFENVAICLATNDKAEIPKLRYLCQRFNQFWEQIAKQGF